LDVPELIDDTIPTKKINTKNVIENNNVITTNNASNATNTTNVSNNTPNASID
jgi:hypothetical protein